jgi:hypothetical protein
MADICVIYASEDEKIVRKLVLLLRRTWEVLWAGDIAQGKWEKSVRSEICAAKAIVPVLSRHTVDKVIFQDEMKFAKDQGKTIFPLFIDKVSYKIIESLRMEKSHAQPPLLHPHAIRQEKRCIRS